MVMQKEELSATDSVTSHVNGIVVAVAVIVIIAVFIFIVRRRKSRWEE